MGAEAVAMAICRRLYDRTKLLVVVEIVVAGFPSPQRLYISLDGNDTKECEDDDFHTGSRSDEEHGRGKR